MGAVEIRLLARGTSCSGLGLAVVVDGPGATRRETLEAKNVVLPTGAAGFSRPQLEDALVGRPRLAIRVRVQITGADADRDGCLGAKRFLLDVNGRRCETLATLDEGFRF